MNKFPILNLYRTLLNIGAVLVLVAGIIATLNEASSGNEFQFGSFVAAILPIIAVSVVLALLAEIIKLGLAIEKHLARIAER